MHWKDWKVIKTSVLTRFAIIVLNEWNWKYLFFKNTKESQTEPESESLSSFRFSLQWAVHELNTKICWQSSLHLWHCIKSVFLTSNPPLTPNPNLTIHVPQPEHQSRQQTALPSNSFQKFLWSKSSLSSVLRTTYSLSVSYWFPVSSSDRKEEESQKGAERQINGGVTSRRGIGLALHSDH